MATLPLKDPHETGNGRATDHPGPDGPQLVSPAEIEAALSVAQDMHLLACLDHGYVKIIPKEAGQELHLTFTWTRGTWTGHYVYVRSEAWNIRKALGLLLWKIDACDQGMQRPARDRYWSRE